jgi:SAM-dependent methyltransferase
VGGLRSEPVCGIHSSFPAERRAVLETFKKSLFGRSYEDQVAQQIAQYKDTIDIHALPEAFHFWSNRYIRPALEDVFGVNHPDGIYIDACRSVVRPDAPMKIFSIGCGDGSVEMRVAKNLLKDGLNNFVITGADLSPILLERFRDQVKAEKLEQYFRIVEEDLNDIKIKGPFDVIMANHSLHHIVELEKLFAFSARELADRGIFVTNDMIGRNGHMRWPETEAVLNSFWPLFNENQQYNVQLKRAEPTFINHDCSTEGFEGIRAQDILPLLLQSFHPRKFAVIGGFVDIVVDRSFGHGFDMTKDQDKALIACMADVNDALLDVGAIKPTIMLAQFTKYPGPEKFYRTRSAANSVRIPT